MPSLFLVATPIGNLEDITLRALRTLGEVKLIAAEDTRHTRLLLSKYDIHTPLTSYHEHNQRAKLGYVLQALEQGDVALVSEAGMPGLNDPGYDLVVACAQRGIPVIAVPGPSAIISALAVSGLPTDQFLYLGFLPRRPGERRRRLESVAQEPCTLVFLEAPHRLRATLAEMLAVLGDRRAAISRELTKLHEEVFRGSLLETLAHFAQPRGEFTLVVEGRAAAPAEVTDEVVQELRHQKQQGRSAREAIAEISQSTGLPRKGLYREWLKLK